MTIRVNGAEDSRWTVALELLRAAEAGIDLGHIRIYWRQTGNRIADGLYRSIQVDIIGPLNPTDNQARKLVDEGLALLNTACEAHPQLGEILASASRQIALVADDGMGFVFVADVQQGGTISWPDHRHHSESPQ